MIIGNHKMRVKQETLTWRGETIMIRAVVYRR
jgi:hypothetical protein